MHVAARARLVLARRPWMYWAMVLSLATLAALAINAEVSSLGAARREWGETRSVLVASAALEPGEVAVAHRIDLPRALLPTGALDQLADGARVRQRVAAGEVLTDLDITTRPGPAALADDGSVVVALADPLSRNVRIGLDVQVVADGFVLADDATVVDVVDEVVFVAVDPSSAPAVAAAAQQGNASLLYLP